MDKQGETALSLKAFQAAVRHKPSSSSYMNLAVCLMRQAQLLQAFEAIDRAWKEAGGDGAQQAEVLDNARALQTWFAHHKLEPPRPWPGEPGNPAIVLGGDAPPSAAAGPPAVFRDELEHQRAAPRAPPIPRHSADEIAADDALRGAFAPDAWRGAPFILVGALARWAAHPAWSASDFRGPAAEWAAATRRAIGDRAVCDFYPHNMLSGSGASPYLTRAARAIDELFVTPGPHQRSKFRYEPQHPQGRYLHAQLTPATWDAFARAGDFAPAGDPYLDHDAALSCLASDAAVMEEFHYKTHWKVLLAGARGAGMFNHSDSLRSSSWHAHLAGEKWWYVCAERGGACAEAIVRPGEVLLYGPGYHHETQNLATPTVTVTDTFVHAANFRQLARKLHDDCVRDRLRFHFSGELCDALQTCFEDWELYWGGHESRRAAAEYARAALPRWRDVATEDVVRKRDSTRPSENNYDGRNYITE